MKVDTKRKEIFEPIEVIIRLENQHEVNFMYELFDIVPSTYKRWRIKEYPLTVGFDEDKIEKSNLHKSLQPYIKK